MQILTQRSLTALHLLAYQYLCQGKPAKAQVLLELLVLHNPTSSALRLALGYALLRTGKVDEAVEVLSILEVSTGAAPQFLYGLALAQAGRKQRAEASFSRYRALRYGEPLSTPSAPHPTE